MGHYLKTKVRSRSFKEKLHDIGFSRSKNCINAPTQDHICYASILKLWNPCWKSYMKEFMEVIPGEGPCHIELLPKGIGGLVCKRLLKIMLRSVTSIRDTPQVSTNLEES